MGVLWPKESPSLRGPMKADSGLVLVPRAFGEGTGEFEQLPAVLGVVDAGEECEQMLGLWIGPGLGQRGRTVQPVAEIISTPSAPPMAISVLVLTRLTPRSYF
jgi:hypothetical protein